MLPERIGIDLPAASRIERVASPSPNNLKGFRRHFQRRGHGRRLSWLAREVAGDGGTGTDVSLGQTRRDKSRCGVAGPVMTLVLFLALASARTARVMPRSARSANRPSRPGRLRPDRVTVGQSACLSYGQSAYSAWTAAPAVRLVSTWHWLARHPCMCTELADTVAPPPPRCLLAAERVVPNGSPPKLRRSPS